MKSLDEKVEEPAKQDEEEGDPMTWEGNYSL
jgi:hypothetical protein